MAPVLDQWKQRCRVEVDVEVDGGGQRRRLLVCLSDSGRSCRRGAQTVSPLSADPRGPLGLGGAGVLFPLGFLPSADLGDLGLERD